MQRLETPRRTSTAGPYLDQDESDTEDCSGKSRSVERDWNAACQERTIFSGEAKPHKAFQANGSRTPIGQLDMHLLSRGDHIGWHRPYMIWHHAIVLDKDVQNKKLHVIHYTKRNKIFQVVSEWINVDKQMGDLFRFDYSASTVQKNPPGLVVQRALTRVGETDYKLLKKNCEHFATDCKTGKGYSAQVRWAWGKTKELLTSAGTRLGFAAMKQASSVVVKKVSNAVAKEVSNAVVKEFKRAVVKEASSVLVKEFSSVIVKDISSVVVTEVSSAVVKEVSSVALKEVCSALVKEVCGVAMKDVSSAAVKEVSSVVVKEVSSAVVKELSSTVVKAVSSLVVKEFSSAVVKEFSSAVVTEVSSAAVKEVSSAVVKEVSSAVMKEVSSVVVKEVSSAVVEGVSSVVVEEVSSVVVEEVSSVVVEEISSEVVKEVSKQMPKSVPESAAKFGSAEAAEHVTKRKDLLGAGIVAVIETAHFAYDVYHIHKDYKAGKMTKQDFKRTTTQRASEGVIGGALAIGGNFLGRWAGGVIGGAAGSVIPIVGSATGAVAGAAVGSVVLGAVGSIAGKAVGSIFGWWFGTKLWKYTRRR